MARGVVATEEYSGIHGYPEEPAPSTEYMGAGYTVRWNDYVVISTPGVKRVLPDIDSMAEALTKIYNADRAKLARRARRFAQRFAWENIFENYWKPFIEQAEIELYPRISEGGVSSWAS